MSLLNYKQSVESRKPKNKISVTPIYKTVENPDGSVSVIEVEKVESPYEGMSADSFSLESQIKAGVNIQKSPRNTNVSINRVDSITNQVNTVIDANNKGIKLNTKNKM